MKTESGVRGFGDGRFWLVLSLYFLACVFFRQAGLQRGWSGVLLPCVGAFLIMSAVAWDHRLIGPPERGHALVLHLAFFVALVFFLNQLVYSFGANVSLLSNPILDSAAGNAIVGFLFDNGVVGVIGKIVSHVFATFVSAILVMLIAFSLSVRRAWSMALLILLLLALTFLTLNAGTRPGAWMIAGCAAVCVALRLQRDDNRRREYWNAVKNRLSGGGRRRRIDVEMSLDLLRRLFEKSFLNEADIRGAVSRRLGLRLDDPRVPAVCRLVLEQMTAQDDVAEIRDGSGGQCLAFRETAGGQRLFTQLALVPRVIVIGLLGVLYYFSPIDIIPDSIPVAGLVDDAVVLVLGGASVIMDCLRLERLRSGGRLFAPAREAYAERSLKL